MIDMHDIANNVLPHVINRPQKKKNKKNKKVFCNRNFLK